MQIQTLEPALAEHPFLKDLAPEYLKLIVGCASNVRFDAGALMAREGDEADHFYIIRHGQVALEFHEHRRGPLNFHTVSEGGVLGWEWLFPPYRWQFDARAVTLVRAIALDGQCLRSKCDADHDLGYELMQRFARIIMRRLQATRLQLMDVYA